MAVGAVAVAGKGLGSESTEPLGFVGMLSRSSLSVASAQDLEQAWWALERLWWAKGKG